MAPPPVVQGRHEISDAATALSEWILYGSWGGEAEEEGVLEPEQCHASEEPASAMPDQQHWYMDPNYSDYPA